MQGRQITCGGDGLQDDLLEGKRSAQDGTTEHRATDLRVELDRAHADADRLREEAGEARKQAEAAAQARERASGLTGQLQALQEQNTALLAMLNPVVDVKPGKA